MLLRNKEALWQKQPQNGKPLTAIIALWLAKAAKTDQYVGIHRIAHGAKSISQPLRRNETEMLERLINEADQQIENTLKTDEEWETYHNVTQ